MSAATMRVEVTDLDDWPSLERVDTGLEAYTRYSVSIRPTLTLHRDVLVTGRQWLPISEERVVLLVHTPSLYFRKTVPSALSRTAAGIVAHTGPIRRVAGTAILIGSAANYYHWMIDHVARLLMARRVMRVPRLLIGPPTPMQRQTLELLGIQDWEEVHEHESVACDELWIPSMLASTTLPHPAIPRLMREAFAVAPGKPQKTYISRRDAPSRRLVNEAAVEALLAKKGYTTHVTGLMDVAAQAQLFADARSMVAVHGAGMTNMLFSPPGAQVYELYTPLHKATYFQTLALACGHRHTFIPARNVSFGADGNPMMGDWEASIEEMEQRVA